MSLVRFRSQNHPQQTTKDAVDDRGTDPLFFAQMVDRFGPFTLDVAAAPHNAKCERYFTREYDGLSRSWHRERVWCNPPYSNIEPWVAKAWAEWNRRDPIWQPPELIVMLLPANRTEQGWWQREVEFRRDRGGPLSVEFLPGRLRFVRHGDGMTEIGPNERPPFGCCLLIWGAA